MTSSGLVVYVFFIFIYIITRTAPNIGGVAVKGLERVVPLTVVWRRAQLRAKIRGVKHLELLFSTYNGGPFRWDRGRTPGRRWGFRGVLLYCGSFTTLCRCRYC